MERQGGERKRAEDEEEEEERKIQLVCGERYGSGERKK